MIGFPIDPIVQKTLNERKQVLKRNKNPYAPTDGKNPNKEIQKNLVRTPYISMFSSPKLISPTGDTNNQLDEGDIILSNQEYIRICKNGMIYVTTNVQYLFTLQYNIVC